MLPAVSKRLKEFSDYMRSCLRTTQSTVYSMVMMMKFMLHVAKGSTRNPLLWCSGYFSYTCAFITTPQRVHSSI